MNYFEELHRNVGDMGEPLEITEPIVTFVKRRLPDWFRALDDGIEIDILDLDPVNNSGGLLGYQGAQILLFLQNQEEHFDRIENGQFSYPKYHVADCKTLREMRRRNQFERYVVTNDKSGVFRLNGPAGRTMDAELDICRNCLSHLNYRGYQTNTAARSAIFSSFNIESFFAIYSSLFKILPRHVNQSSFDTRREVTSDDNGYAHCVSCKAHLPATGHLLGYTSTAEHNNNVYCLDCQRKLNLETPQPVSRDNMIEIASARRKLRPLSEPMTWEEVYSFADSAYEGLLRKYQQQGWDAPEPGVDITDENGTVCLQLGLAWLDGDSGIAVVLDEDQASIARSLGWEVQTLNEALLDSN